MKQLKRILGITWIIAGPLMIITLLWMAVKNIDLSGSADINKPVPWIIIIGIFTPIAIGFSIFGWYAWKGEYEEDNKS
jgi:hypothetical protein